MSKEVAQELGQFATQVDDWFAQRLTGFDAQTREPMLYALQGGKKLRGFLVMQSAALFDLPANYIMPAVCAIEAMHSYSLVHDDLPAMDDDDLRRGRATLHKAYDEAGAILAGDSLQSLAFELLTDLRADYDTHSVLTLIKRMAYAAGANGMVLGQAQDIAAETAQAPLSLEDIKTLQANKTGALIGWCSTAGAVLAQRDDSALRSYGQHLGLAFQIWDDVLDVIGDVKQTGKAVNKDATLGKATFVSHLGLEGAKLQAKNHVEQAIAALADYGDSAKTLQNLAQFTILRKA